MPSTQALATAALDLLQSLEDGADLTVLGAGPATLSALPDALGGDPGQQADLADGASSPLGFLNLLRGKAHYLMLPATVVADLRDAGVPVQFSNVEAASSGDAVDTSTDLVEVRLASAAPTYLAGLGAALGRQSVQADTAPLRDIYQQLARAWLTGVAPSRPDWPGILSASTDSYQDTQVTSGASADPQEACMQAAEAYVAARAAAWFDALQALSNAIQAQAATDHKQLASMMESARNHYDAVAVQQAFGAIDGSPIESPALPDDLRQALDTDVLGDLPLIKTFDETPLRPLYDAILAGEVASGQASEDDQLILDIARRLVARAGWGADPDRDALERSVVTALHSALEEQGTAGTYEPVAGAQITPLGLARGIRAALNLSDSAPVGWEQVVAVLQEVLLDQDPFSSFELLKRVGEMPDDLQPSWDAIDPEEADPDISMLAAQTVQDVLYGSGDMAAPAFPTPAAPAAMGSISVSNLIKGAMRRNKKFFSTILEPQTQQTGNVVQRIIQADYILQHPGHRVLIDFNVWDSAMQAWRVLDSHGEEDLVRQFLVSSAGDRYKPDICDLDSREVFEIKPFRKVFTGLAQLYLHYLIPLNVGLLGLATAKAILESIDGTGAFTTNVSLPKTPFLPGTTFKSPRWYPLGTSWVFVILAAPGVIGYQVVSDVGKDAVELESLEARQRLLDLMATMIAAAVAALGARNVSGRPFTPDDLPPLAATSSPGVTTSPDMVARALLFVAIAALLVLTLGPPALPILPRLPILAVAP
jgi:hypothetical protein